MASEIEDRIARIADCSHGTSIRLGEAERCPHCGAMRVSRGPWALPHDVAALVAAWRENSRAVDSSHGS